MNRPLRLALAVALLVLALIALVGGRAGWFHVGFSEAQLEELDRDWAQVVEWANLPRADAADLRPLTELALEWRELEDRGDADSDREALVQRFEAWLAEGPTAVPTESATALAVLQLGQLAVQAEDLDAARVGHLLTLSRRFQAEGHMMIFLVGTALGNEVLERCREDGSLLPTALAAPAPRSGDLFTALCRDYVVLHDSQIAGDLLAEDGEDPLARYAGADEFLERSTQAAMLRIVRRYEPLRDEPRRFGEVPVPEPPGWITLWTAATFRRPVAMARVVETLLHPDLDLRGEKWAEFVEEWGAVLGR